MQSKEDKVMELFFNNPTKEWHFEEILKGAKIARSKADSWLKRFARQGILKRIKVKGRMPYYISNYMSPEYKVRKKLFALNKMHGSGLLSTLESLKHADTIIIFGSFSRSDWYKDSDIDIFIYGSPKGLRIADFELKLNRNIQLFICQDRKEISRLDQGLIKNIIRGNVIKGNLDFIEVAVNA